VELFAAVDIQGGQAVRLRRSDIAAQLAVPVEYGGGVRSPEALERVASSEVRWVVLGTAAVTGGDLVDAAVARLGERLVVSVDCDNGMVATHGWRQRSEMSAHRFIAQLADSGVRRVVYTDIATDGMMRGPNLPGLVDLARSTSLEILQSGGISTLDDLRRLRELAPPNVVGVIVGRALYEEAFTIAEALEVLE
jgi:phosphoribosylformimino-5-aminoimidazole carboxamide ribotide isomerase